MFRHLAVVCLLLASSEMICQKILQKSYDASSLSSVVLKADGVHAITITSEVRKDIVIITEIHGETYENVMLDVVQTENTLIIKPDHTPFFIPENDKLAAHKVLAIEITVLLPTNFEVTITSNMAQVLGSGHYKALNTSLAQGNCSLSQFSGNAKLWSKSGSISVKTLGNVRSKKVVSKRGKVIDNLPKQGRFAIVAETISGDITLEQTK